MARLKVCIRFRPLLYHEIFKKLFRSFEDIEVVEALHADMFSSEAGRVRFADVFVLPIDEKGRPEMELLPGPVPGAKIIAISPHGRLGMRRSPGQNRWEAVEPFGLAQLIREVVRAEDQDEDGSAGPH